MMQMMVPRLIDHSQPFGAKSTSYMGRWTRPQARPPTSTLALARAAPTSTLVPARAAPTSDPCAARSRRGRGAPYFFDSRLCLAVRADAVTPGRAKAVRVARLTGCRPPSSGGRMTVLQLPFRLPQSCVRIAGTRAFAHDTLLDRDDVSAQATVTLDVIAEHELSTLRIAEGVLADTDVGFEWTDDGRLVTSSVELTGRAGAVAVGAVSAATSVAGVLLGAPALALSRAGAPAALAARPAARRGRRWGGRRPRRRRPTASGAPPGAADARACAARAAEAQAVGAAYRAAHPDESEAREACAGPHPRARARPGRRPAPGAGRRRRQGARRSAGRGARRRRRARRGARPGRRPRRALPRLAGDHRRHAARALRVPARARHARRRAGAARAGRRPAAFGRRRRPPSSSPRWPRCRPPSRRWA